MDEKEAWYRGDVLNCIRHGKGVYNYPFGGQKLFTYDGNWNQGVKHDKGIFKVNGYSIYKGEMKNGEMTGKGSKSWDDGRTYDGEWLNGEMHGKGYWVNTKTNEVYDGYFIGNRRSGVGNLQRGLESYKGEFKNHKFHGAGTYLFSNKFILEGTFEENVLQGNTSVDWQRLAITDGQWRDGLPNGDGFFSTLDRTFDFQGHWADGLPDVTQTTGKLWVGVDRTMVDLENARVREARGGKADKKKAAPPPKKGKGEAAAIEPTLIALQGENLGVIGIRCILARDPNESVVVVAPIDPKKPPVKGVPVPVVAPAAALFAVPCERIRRVTIRLRPVIEEVSDPAAPPLSKAAAAALLEEPRKPLQLGAPVCFWLKRQSQEQAACQKSRFGPRSAVVMCDVVLSEQSWSRAYSLLSGRPCPALVIRRAMDQNCDDSVVTGGTASDLPQSAIIPAAMVHDETQLDSVSSYLLSRDLTASVSLDSSALTGSEEQLVLVVDFRVDAATCVQQHIDRYQPDGYYRENKRSLSRSLQSAGSRSGNSLAGGAATTSPVKRLGKTFKSRDMEVLLCSFTKPSPERPVTDCKRLDLVLVVALKNTDEVYVQKRDAAAAAEEVAAIAAEKSRRASFMGTVESLLASDEPALSTPPVVWTDCYWELRCTITHTTTTLVETKPGQSRRKKSVRKLSEEGGSSIDGLSHDLAQSVTTEGSVALEGGAAVGEAGLDVDAAEPLPDTINTTESKTTVCGQWLCGDFCPELWHSVALTLRCEPIDRPRGSSDDDSLCSPSVSATASLNQLNNEKPDRRPSSRGDSSSRPESLSDVVSAELTLDGQGRLRVVPGGNRRASSPTATSYEAAQRQTLNATQQTQGVVSEWMRDYPRVALQEVPSVASVTQQASSPSAASVSKPARKVSVADTASLPEVVLPPDFNNKLNVTLGSAEFNGHVKGVALCTRTDRCDLSHATGCYEQWRREQETLGGDAAAGASSNTIPFGAIEASAVSDPSNAPPDYHTASEFHTTLFCGSGEVSVDRIRIPSAPLSSSSSSQPESEACLMPEGLYVLEVSDGVNEECQCCLSAEGELLEGQTPLGETDLPVKLKKLPRDVQDMMRVARRLSPNVEIIVKVEPAELM